jgi:predicted ABC-type ATPase
MTEINTIEKKPDIIITVGPTGSGKSSLPDLIIKELGLSANYIDIQIDAVVGSNPEFKRGINKLMYEKGINKANNNSVIMSKLNNELGSKLSSLYFKVRKGPYCEGISCNTVNDKILNDAIEKGKNIVFETMGSSNIDWLISMIEGKYTIIIAYMILDYNTLIQRVKGRALSGFKKYMEKKNNTNTKKHINNKSIVGPRYPSLEKHVFGPLVKTIYSTLINLILSLNGIDKVYQKLENLYSYDKFNIDYLYIYDNKEKTPELQYIFRRDKIFGNYQNLITKIESYMSKINDNERGSNIKTKVNKNTSINTSGKVNTNRTKKINQATINSK